MALIIDVLILFIILSCIFKLSMMKWWQQLLYSLLLATFAWWSVRYAVLQSKTQLAEYLQNTVALQNMAIIVTIESAVGLVYALTWLSPSKHTATPHRLLRLLLQAYPSLLMFPVVFYLLTQTIFAATGIKFQTIGLLFAATITLLLPSLSLAAKRLLPDDTSRIEIYLLLVVFITILGLLSTQHGQLIYAVKENPVNWTSLALTLLLFALSAAAGIILHRIKQHLNHKHKL